MANKPPTHTQAMRSKITTMINQTGIFFFADGAFFFACEAMLGDGIDGKGGVASAGNCGIFAKGAASFE